MPTPFVIVGDRLSDAPAGTVLRLPEDTARHLRRVLRLAAGAAIAVGDGHGAVARARLEGDGHARLAEDAATMPRPQPSLEVWQALGKGRKHDEVVRVLTELGVDHVTAVTSKRTVVDLADKTQRVRQRWEAVARSACEQARRAYLPAIDGPINLAAAVANHGEAPLLVADVQATTDPLGALAGVDADRVVLAVGPEGGWAPDELRSFEAAGAIAVTLGPTVLRTEHAAVVLAAVAAAATGRMHSAVMPPWSIDSTDDSSSIQRPADNDAP